MAFIPLRVVCIVTLFTCITFQTIWSTTTWCKHELPTVSSVITRVAVHSRRRFIRQPSPSSLRIHVHYDDSIRQLTSFEEIKTSVLDVAVQFWQNALRLRSHGTTSSLLLDRSCLDGLTKLRTLNQKLLTFCVNGCRNVTKCGPVAIPEEHLSRCRFIKNGSHMLSGNQGHGLKDTDFILYIASLRTTRCDAGNVLGYAAHCQLASQTDRPIAGYINFCPNALGARVSDRVRSLFVAKHELLHALGFSSSLFAMYRDHQNRPLTPRDPTTQLPALGLAKIGSHTVYQWSDKVVRVVERRWLSAYGNHTKLAHIVVTPTVLKVAREFFNCPTLDGVELEDQDEVGVFLTHWEKRLLENELMTATYTNSYRVSPITLAMMEDTGWYVANYTKSHDFSWGSGLGCSFAMASCLEYMLEQRKKGHAVNPFCQQIQPPLHRTEETGVQVSCTPDGVSYGFCNLINHPKPLPNEYVYFVQKRHPLPGLSGLELADGFANNQGEPLDNVGGKIALANYCPYYQEIEWERKRDEPTVNTHCHTLNNYKEPKNNFKLEQFTPNSICVQHSPNWRLHNNKQVFGLPVEGAGCYSFRCSFTEGGLVIELAGGIALPCVVPGSPVRVKACLKSQGLSIDGQLICPDCSLLCDPRECPVLNRNFSHLRSRKFAPLHLSLGALFRTSQYSLPYTILSSSRRRGASMYNRPQEIFPDYCPSSGSNLNPPTRLWTCSYIILGITHLLFFLLTLTNSPDYFHVIFFF